MRPADFRPADYSLAQHGDSRQRTWAHAIVAHCPHYESVWARYVVPMTFHVQESGNYFLRPTLPEELIDLADTHYAVFFHLAQMHEWRRNIERTPAARGIGSTEGLYCFFSHAASLRDATLNFGAALDAILLRYERPSYFEVTYDENGHAKDLGEHWGMTGDRRSWNALRKDVGDTRNFLVHKRPVFLQNHAMPRAEYLDAMSGLTAISRVARDPTLLAERYTEVLPEMDRLLLQAAKTLDAVFSTALQQLDAIDDPRFARERFEVRKGDRKITKAMILAVREMTLED